MDNGGYSGRLENVHEWSKLVLHVIKYEDTRG